MTPTVAVVCLAGAIALWVFLRERFDQRNPSQPFVVDRLPEGGTAFVGSAKVGVNLYTESVEAVVDKDWIGLRDRWVLFGQSDLRICVPRNHPSARMSIRRQGRDLRLNLYAYGEPEPFVWFQRRPEDFVETLRQHNWPVGELTGDR